ncbi:MAG: phospholipase D-like domain-containing protein, partial [Chloroflexota bacterium]|nr:phospholipase D-like domain-containing protein [Chloroflexota bacterium]
MARRFGSRRRGSGYGVLLGLVLLLALVVLGSYALRSLGREATDPADRSQATAEVAAGGGRARPGGADRTTGGVANVAVDEFWVEPDDGLEPILQQMKSARSTLDVVVYLLTDRQVIEEIVAAHHRGVKVRVILEEDPFGGGGSSKAMQQLDAAGVPWKGGHPAFRYTHEKAVVLDGKRALVMTAN